MYYEKHRGRVDESSVRKLKLIIVLVITIAAALVINTQLRRVIADAAAVQAQNRFSAAAADATTELIENGCSFDVVLVSKSEDGGVESLVSDTGQINRIKSMLTQSILNGFSDDERRNIRLSLGTLSGIELFAGRGPTVEVHMELCGGVNTELKSEFSEAGINQTLHRLYCTVTAEFYLIMPGQRFMTVLNTTVPLTESVIVGDVPEAYTYVVGDENDTIGRIFDYGANQ